MPAAPQVGQEGHGEAVQRGRTPAVEQAAVGGAAADVVARELGVLDDGVAAAAADEVADPWIALAAVAMATERLRLGPMVTPLPRRRPWKLARETVSVDRLSNGRLTLGRASGHWRACSATSWVPATSPGASRWCWRTRCRCWRAACP